MRVDSSAGAITAAMLQPWNGAARKSEEVESRWRETRTAGFRCRATRKGALFVLTVMKTIAYKLTSYPGMGTRLR